MERIRNLDRYQKGILILLPVMLVIFAAVYYVTVSRVGLFYHEEILIPGKENGNTTYSGKISGTEAVFTVTSEKTVMFRYGEKTYGPYTVTEDPTAVPQGDSLSNHMTGFEIRNGEEMIFRGGGLKNGGEDGYWMLYNEDGSFSFDVTVVASGGIVTDGEGNIIDPMEPSVSTILDLVYGPKLTHKGQWQFLLIGAVLSVMIVPSVLFPDELFRWNLRYRVRNVDRVEPSEWEIASRYIGWTVMAIGVFVFYMMGLGKY